MILLNEPWSVTERRLEAERRRAATTRAINLILYCLACVMLGVFLGILICP